MSAAIFVTSFQERLLPVRLTARLIMAKPVNTVKPYLFEPKKKTVDSETSGSAANPNANPDILRKNHEIVTFYYTVKIF